MTTQLPKYEATRLSAADTAKLIRVELRKHFPGTKFSVRSRSYGMGAHVHVGWTDGPTKAAVEEVVRVFEGHGFDGMIDLAYSIDAWVLHGEVIGTRSQGTAGSRGTVHAWGLIPPHDDAELMHFGCYVFCERKISPALANACIPKIAAWWGGVSEPLPVAVGAPWGFELAGRRDEERVRPDLSAREVWASEIHRCAEAPERYERAG